jgi:ACS family pantothenate transporter-like MFS transporter
VGYWIGITGVITSALILAYPQNTTIHFAMYYWAGSVYACQATFFAWANDVLRYEEDSLRAVVIASMNMGSNAINAFWSILLYPASDAPLFTNGMKAMIAVSIAMAFWTGALVWMHVRSEKRRELVGTTAHSTTKEQDIRDTEQGQEKA